MWYGLQFLHEMLPQMFDLLLCISLCDVKNGNLAHNNGFLIKMKCIFPQNFSHEYGEQHNLVERY